MLETLHLPPPGKPAAPPQQEIRTLIDQLIAEQNQLQTPAARFAEIHDRQPDLADHYRTLIPLTRPGPGEQYAFEVSLDRCTGCKACVSACHSLNGLDDHEAWRDTGTLVGGSDAPGWQQTVTTACHHCEDPGCLNGCPVGAYEKDRTTGIVHHLDDQCIGCSYCILKCPYDVPKYSKKRGIVRKCDMCHQRLAEGEAPACVQACPTEAIRIVKVASSQERVARDLPESNLFLSAIRNRQSAVPSSSITLPTTRYVGREVPATVRAADRDQLIPQHPHWPLVLMLVLTQSGIGILSGGAFQAPSQLINNSTSLFQQPAYQLLLLGTLLFNAGMIAAVFHLGQPLKAWRFFLGLRTSWLSREILAFSLFAPIPLVLCALPLSPDFLLKHSISQISNLSCLAAGTAAIFTSIMIYVDTRRSLWSLPRTAARFFGTLLNFLFLALAILHPHLRPLAAPLILTTTFPELLFLFRHASRPSRLRGENPLSEPPWTPDLHSARLQLHPLKKITLTRFALALAASAITFFQPWLALPILLTATLLERQLFFQSVQAPKMPGHFGPTHHP